jgi:hypothetical protein
VADGSEQATYVVDGTDKDAAEQNPNQGWQPSPNDSDGWTEKRSQTRNRSEVVTEENGWMGWDIISVIPHGVSRRWAAIIQLHDSPRQKRPVKTIG